MKFSKACKFFSVHIHVSVHVAQVLLTNLLTSAHLSIKIAVNRTTVAQEWVLLTTDSQLSAVITEFFLYTMLVMKGMRQHNQLIPFSMPKFVHPPSSFDQVRRSYFYTFIHNIVLFSKNTFSTDGIRPDPYRWQNIKTLETHILVL